MQPADHGQRQRALAAQDFVDAVAFANHRLEIFNGQTALIHPEFDGFYWIRRSDGHVLGLVGLHQRGEDIQAIPLRRAQIRVGLHQGRNLFKRGLVVCFGVDRADVHVFLRGRSGHFNGFCVHCVVLLVGADELHVDDLQLVRNGHDQPVIIAFDVEDHATVLQHAGAAVQRLDVCGLSPGRIRCFLIPSLQRLLGVGMALPEGSKGGHGNYSHGSQCSPILGLSQPCADPAWSFHDTKRPFGTGGRPQEQCFSNGPHIRTRVQFRAPPPSTCTKGFNEVH